MTLQKDFDELFMNRTDNPKSGMTEMEALEYELTKEKLNNIINFIKEMNSQNSNDLWLELDSEIGTLQVVLQNGAYRRGLKDGIELSGGIKIFGLDYVIKPFPPKSETNEQSEMQNHCNLKHPSLPCTFEELTK